MQHFLPVIANSLSVGQKQSLSRFLSEIEAGRVAADPERIVQALDQIGSIIPLPAIDPTDPDGYNLLVQTLQTNLSGLYQEVDLLESIQDAMQDLNATELDKTEIALRDLTAILEAVERASEANHQYTDVFYETFGADVSRETDRDWYKPIPALALSGFVESYLPLFVDPEDRSLKLLPGGDFLRSTNSRGEQLAQVEVEELLGISLDRNHPVVQAVDGNFFTYWRELALSEFPIQADPLQIPWLPEKYIGGTAARLHFRFPSAVPFTEIVIKPFARFPLQVLQVVWDNRKVAVANLLQDPFFTSGNTFWTSGATIAQNVLSYVTNGGIDNHSYANIEALSGRTTLRSNTYTLSGSQFAYHLLARLKRDSGIQPRFLVQWYKTNGDLARADWHSPTTPVNQWYEVSKLFIAPSGITSGYTGTVTAVMDGSGTVQLTQASFSQTVGALNLEEQARLEADSLLVGLDNAAGTDLWLVLAQPHYELLQLALPEGELDQAAVWEDILLQSEARARDLLGVSPSLWQQEAGIKNSPPALLVEDGSNLLREALRLGGKIRELVVSLKRYATPSTRTRQLNRFLYVLGAWEIQVRHREYAPQGLFVSKPYRPRGEVREAILQTDPPLSSLSDRIKFWITAREGDRADRAKSFTGRATFSSTTEQVSKTADTHFSLAPVAVREQFAGTDRLNRIPLGWAPYVDRDRVWTTHTRLTSGTIATPLTYDPNQEVVFLTQGTSLVSLAGYRPIKVTLEFADGTVARPDLLGRVKEGDIGFSGPEILETAIVEQTTNTQSNSIANFLRTIDARQQKEQSQTIGLTAVKTKFGRIISSTNGVNLSLYWHKSALDTPASGIYTATDVRISPSRYTVDAEKGLIVVRDTIPSGNTDYDSFIAYYYYTQSEAGARAAQDSRTGTQLPTSGVDLDGTLPRTQVITRNVTDYIHGQTNRLRPANLDDLDPDFYPVYEYLIDDHSRVVFADNFSIHGDRPAKVIVEYESLKISPRLVIEVRRSAINDFSTRTPKLDSYTLLLNSRK